MDHAENRETLKRRAVAALAEARLELDAGLHRVRRDYDPRSLMAQSVQKHRLWWMAAAATGGFTIIWRLFSARPTQDSAVKTVVKRTLGGVLLSSLWPLVRGPLIDFATKHAHTFLSERFTHPAPQPPEDPL